MDGPVFGALASAPRTQISVSWRAIATAKANRQTFFGSFFQKRTRKNKDFFLKKEAKTFIRFGAA
jgi:hypothetical protein